MNQDWHAFLLSEGGFTDHNGTATFAATQLPPEWPNSGNVMFGLTDTTVIRVSGEDAEIFLQNQFSNDIIEARTQSRLQLNAYCNPKGRTIALVRVLPIADAFLLLVPVDLAEPLIKKLRMYVLRSKVIIKLDENLVVMGLAGPDATTALSPSLTAVPEQANQAIAMNDLTVARISDPSPRFVIVTHSQSAINLWRQFRDQFCIAGPAQWALRDMLCGQPNIHAETSELFVPQMLNLDLIDGISFTKGCYPGQEIVARMHYLGKLKRRLFLATFKASKPPARGTDLYGQSGTQSVGKIVDAEILSPSNIAVLVVLQISHHGNEPVHVGSADGALLSWKALPYDVQIDK